MLDAISILQILSRPGAIAQDVDGSFFIFTQGRGEFGRVENPRGYSVSNQPGGVFAAQFFDLSPIHWRAFEGCYKLERPELTEALNIKYNHNNFSYLPQWLPQERSHFDDDFSRIKTAIAAGQISKAVVMTSEHAEGAPSPDERLILLLRLLKNCPNHLFIYGHWDDQKGVLGATPELLFSRQGQHLRTMALAGTLPKDKSRPSLPQAQQLLADKKERLEHQFVVEDLTEKLDRFFASSVPTESSTDSTLEHLHQRVLVEEPKVIELPHLFHLFTAIEGKLEVSSVPEDGFEASVDYRLIKQLHPSSALGLRSSATPWSWLKNLRGHQSLGHFGAPFGVPTPNGFLCLVGIRNIEWSHGSSVIRAGCGIVELSQPDREWQELKAKRDSVKSLLGLV